MGAKRQPMQAPNCCVHEIEVKPSRWDYCFILQGAFHNNDAWTWGIERLAFLSFECKAYDNLFVNP
jgi:hypothetical protein